MIENLLKKKLKENKSVPTKEEDIVKRSLIFLERDANGIRNDQHWENMLFSYRYIPVFKKWLFLVSSPYYKETETTIFSLYVENDIVILSSSFWLEEIKYKIEETFYNDLADAFLTMVKTDGFVELNKIFNDLANKQFFDLTIFKGDFKLYSPENLYMKVNNAYFKQLINETTGNPKIREFFVPCTEETLVHQPYIIREYEGKLGEINGFRIICTKAESNGMTFQFVGL